MKIFEVIGTPPREDLESLDDGPMKEVGAKVGWEVVLAESRPGAGRALPGDVRCECVG